MSGLPTREEADRLIGYRPVNLDHNSLSPEDRVFLARADGILQTADEWRQSLNLQAATDHLEWCRGLRISTGMMAELIDAAETGEWGGDRR